MNKKLLFLVTLLLVVISAWSSEQVVEAQNPTAPKMPYQPPENCLPCHTRQYTELRQAVKSGYRSVSPTFNALELAGNAGSIIRATTRDPITGNVLDYPTLVNVRPFYAPDTNIISADKYRRKKDGRLSANDVGRAGFCIGCHAPVGLLMGDNPKMREVPPIFEAHLQNEDSRVQQDPTDPTSLVETELNPNNDTFFPNGLDRRKPVFIKNLRPLRDYSFIDVNGKLVVPKQPGGLVPNGQRNLNGAGISCDTCHNTAGPDLTRTYLKDGLGNIGMKFDLSTAKVGPFFQAQQVKDNFHQSSSDSAKVNYIRSSDFCNSCHDVRIPTRDFLTREVDPGSAEVRWVPGRSGFLNQESDVADMFRLENLSTEHRIGPYNSKKNPFGHVVRCQDCHMSLFPNTTEITYTVRDRVNNRDLVITSPRPADGLGSGEGMPVNFAADPTPGVSTPDGINLNKRRVVTHYMTGCDIPLLTSKEMNERLNVKAGTKMVNGVVVKNDSTPVPGVFSKDVDEYGNPIGIDARRTELLKAAVRLDLGLTQTSAELGKNFRVGVTATALTGHRFPAGFSQERTTYVDLTVSGKDKKTGKDIVIYQSGYLVDKPHPETGELQPDGNLDDEDLEHSIFVVNPYTGDNDVYYEGPDTGPDNRTIFGKKEGLVLFRNELRRVYLPPSKQPNDNLLPPNRLRGQLLSKPHVEEIFPAGLANTVNNWRSLPPLDPRTYFYDIKLPSKQELAKLGIEIEGKLNVKATVNFSQFPPLFLRFLVRVVGGVSAEQALRESPYKVPMPDLFTEERIDKTLKNVRNLAVVETSVTLR